MNEKKIKKISEMSTSDRPYVLNFSKDQDLF